MSPEETDKAWRKLPKGAVLKFERFTMQHSDRYAQGQALQPCGCYWCQSQAQRIDLELEKFLAKNSTANPQKGASEE